ncbi:MAG: transposase [Ignavibacteria bacterium]
MYTKQIRSLSKERRYKRDAELLTKIPGISTLSAMIILTELGDIKIYIRLDKLCGYVELIPDEHTTGDKEKKTKMTKRGNRRLRRILMRNGWCNEKNRLYMLAYKKYSQRHGKAKAIIKITKVLNRIRCVLVTGKEYEIIQPQIIKAGDEKDVA